MLESVDQLRVEIDKLENLETTLKFVEQNIQVCVYNQALSWVFNNL